MTFAIQPLAATRLVQYCWGRWLTWTRVIALPIGPHELDDATCSHCCSGLDGDVVHAIPADVACNRISLRAALVSIFFGMTDHRRSCDLEESICDWAIVLEDPSDFVDWWILLRVFVRVPCYPPVSEGLMIESRAWILTIDEVVPKPDLLDVSMRINESWEQEIQG
jgi:hypothetical protein